MTTKDPATVLRQRSSHYGQLSMLASDEDVRREYQLVAEILNEIASALDGPIIDCAEPAEAADAE
jgi:hypothetical protein